MSQWTHPQCAACFRRERPRLAPFRLTPEHRTAEVCCWCGEPTAAGIYNRADPASLAHHTEHVDG